MANADPAGTGSEEEQAVLATLRRLLATVAARDKAAMAELLFPDGCAVQSRDHQVTWTPLRGLPDLMPAGEATLEERFHHPLVRVDDYIAVVWSRYDFFVDGDVHHWGTNILSFLKQDGRWRVSAIADNGRTSSRPADWDRA